VWRVERASARLNPLGATGSYKTIDPLSNKNLTFDEVQ
jgi:hypothetical protein